MGPARRTAERPPTAVSIATSDSGGGAGIQADLLTFAAHGVHGATVLVAATAQDSLGVSAVVPLPAPFVRRQIAAVFGDFRPRAVKIGALFDAERVRVVATELRRRRPPAVVLDPVLAATSGRRLLSAAGVRAMRERLLSLCDLVTPNLAEAQALARIRVRGASDRRLAAGILADLGARAVLITGGHVPGREVEDLLFDGRFFTSFRAPRMTSAATHGTGCTLSAAIAANFALGRSLEDAIARAIAFVREGLERGIRPGRGPGIPRRLARRP